MIELTPCEKLGLNVLHAAKTIEVSICTIAGYDKDKALKGLAALMADIRRHIIRRCDETTPIR